MVYLNIYLVQVSVVQPQPLCRCVSILHFELRDGWITIHRKVHAVNSLGQHSTVSVGCCDTGVVEGAQHRGKAPARNCTGANNAVAVVSTNLDVSQWRILFFGQWIHSDKPPIFQTKMTLSEMTTCTTTKNVTGQPGKKVMGFFPAQKQNVIQLLRVLVLLHLLNPLSFLEKDVKGLENCEKFSHAP